MRLLVFGRTGQVASEMQRRLPAGIEARFLGREDVDLADLTAVEAAVAGCVADAVVNAAAYTAVDRAESAPDLAGRINGDAPGAMARVAAASGIPLIHLSTDYVFDGSGDKPWTTNDGTGPKTAYGRSKLKGEAAIRAVGGVHAIIRTSWVFSVHGANFLKTMLRLGRERDVVSVVSDQIGGPTPASAIADMLFVVAERLVKNRTAGGTFHFAGAPDVSWADFARAIFAEAGMPVQVKDIGSADYPTAATRPLNSRLDCSAIASLHGIARPDWKSGLSDVVRELKAGAGA